MKHIYNFLLVSMVFLDYPWPFPLVLIPLVLHINKDTTEIPKDLLFRSVTTQRDLDLSLQTILPFNKWKAKSNGRHTSVEFKGLVLWFIWIQNFRKKIVSCSNVDFCLSLSSIISSLFLHKTCSTSFITLSSVKVFTDLSKALSDLWVRMSQFCNDSVKVAIFRHIFTLCHLNWISFISHVEAIPILALNSFTYLISQLLLTCIYASMHRS